MQAQPVNAQTWLLGFNVNQAIEVKGGERMLFVSGQTSNDANGAPMHAGDIAAQAKLAWANLVEVLAKADMTPANVVRLNFYTTDVQQFMAHAGEIIPLWKDAGCTPTSTLLGVAALFHPDIMLEIEATAVA